MHINIIYSYYQTYYDWAVTASYCLRKMGIESDVFCPVQDSNIRNLKERFVYPEADYYMVLNQAQFGWYNLPQNAQKILWFTEQVDFDSSNQHILNKSAFFAIQYQLSDFVIVPNRTTTTYLEGLGYKIHGTFGLGYDEILTKYKDKVTRINDVYFCGGLNSRRKLILDSIKDAQINVLHKNEYLDEYHQLLANSKIVLNIHSYSLEECSTNFGLLRLIMSASEGAMLITEETSDPYPFVENNIIICSAQDIPKMCKYYLENEEERKLIAKNGFFRLKNSYRMEDLLYTFIRNNLDKDFQKNSQEAEIPEVKI